MAVFSKHDRNKPAQSGKNGATIISRGTQIKGDISLTSSLHVDGEIEGLIHSDNTVTIGSNGQVIGEIMAKNLVINGKLIGSAASDSIDIMSNGHVKGKLTYEELTIEKGAVFEGETSQISQQKTTETEENSRIQKSKNSKAIENNDITKDIEANGFKS